MLIDTVKTNARKSALAYVGAWAMASDYAVEKFDEFAKRGEKVEREARKQFRKANRMFNREVAQGEEQAEELRDEIVDTASSFSDRAADLTNRISTQVFNTLNIPTHTDIEELDSQVARLTVQIDELRSSLRRRQTAVPTEPLPGYEKMNADEVIARLPELNEPMLLALRAHEQQHANRVTVLRAIERTLVERYDAAGELAKANNLTTVEPIPGYSKLTAEEAIERMHNLSEAEVLHVKVYEQEHLARVTVLRAADERLVKQEA